MTGEMIGSSGRNSDSKETALKHHERPLGLTVAICTRNRPGELHRALLSLTKQTVPPSEILVIDNAPMDDASRTLVEEQFPMARYVREPIPGLDFARNRALRESGEDLVAFLDDDAVAHENWSREIMRVFAENPRVGACTGRVVALSLETEAQRLFEANGGFSRGEVRIRLPGDAKKELRGRRVPLIAWAVSVGNGCSLALRRGVVLGLGGFDEALDLGAELPGGGDLDILWRILANGFEVIYEPRAGASHEHRRDLKGVFDQIVGHQRALIAFLIKSIVHNRHGRTLSLLLFLGWRLYKPILRLFYRAVGRDPVPGTVLLRMWWNCWCGVFAYRKALGAADQRRQRAGSIDSETSGGVFMAGGWNTRPPSRLAALWRHRELLRRLVVRNLKVKYQRSMLGFVWTLLNPLVTVGVLTAVFSRVVRIPVPYYWAFLVSGYFVWNFVIQTLNTGTYIFAEHSQLLRSAAFPPEILVFSAAIAKLIEFGVAMLFVLIALVLFVHQGIPASLVLLPLLVAIQLLVVIGLALPITTLSVFYYDVQHALPIALATLFYASPVFYPASLVPESIRPFYMLNPIAGLLTLYHYVVYEGRLPPPMLLIGMVAFSILLCLIGYAVFRRYERVYAELV